MVLEDSSQTFKDEMTKIGQHIAEGTPFSKIPRGLESLSTVSWPYQLLSILFQLAK